MSCYSLQFGKRLDFLKPVSLNATVGLSTKTNSVHLKEEDSSGANINEEKSSKLPKENSAHGNSNYAHVMYTPKEKVSFALNTTQNEKPNAQSQKRRAQNDFSSVSSRSSSGSDLGSLGICVHIDMTPINIQMSEVQICLMASILHGLKEVISNLIPEPPKRNIQTVEVLPPIAAQSSTGTPTLAKESTLDSISEEAHQMAVNTDSIKTDNIKLTAWIQWTVTRFTVSILSHDTKDLSTHQLGYLHKPKLKLVFEAEDIVSSVDFQSVFLKVKSKIGSACILHFKRENVTNTWKPGPFLGFVMRSVEENGNREKQEDNSFANITITRASCKHTHSLWGAFRKSKGKEKVRCWN